MSDSVTSICKLGVKCIEGFRKHNRIVLELNNFNMTKGKVIFISNGLSRRAEWKHSREVQLFELLITAKILCCTLQGKWSLPPFLKFPASSNFLSLSFHKNQIVELKKKRECLYVQGLHPNMHVWIPKQCSFPFRIALCSLSHSSYKLCLKM